MKPFQLLAVFSLFFACIQKQEASIHLKPEQPIYTEAEARKVFEDSIAGFELTEYPIEKFPRFLQTFYPALKTKTPDALIYAMEEPLIDTTKVDSARQWFRLTVDPCFRLPYSFIVEKIGNKSYLTLKITNGLGCQYPGALTSTTKYRFVGELYDTVAAKLKSLDFWTLGRDTTCHGGLDGETWLIEAIENGKYNAIYRWVPQRCGDSVTYKLAGIGKHLGKISRLDNVLEALGARKSGL